MSIDFCKVCLRKSQEISADTDLPAPGGRQGLPIDYTDKITVRHPQSLP
jgi:hypothetical protein